MTLREHLSRQEALSLLIAQFPPLGARVLPLEETLGLLLADDLVGRRNVPHYPA